MSLPRPVSAGEGIPRARVRTDTVKVLVLGDLMMHTRQLSYDSRGFLQELQPLLGGADLVIGGAEFTLAGPPHTGYPRFSAPDTYPVNLRASGVDVLLAANNHILDYGCRGLGRTLTHLGEPWCGAGADSATFAQHNPLFVRVGGTSLALVNCTYGTNLGPDRPWPKVARLQREELGAQMERASEADFVLALPHWGNEYELRHSPDQEKWAAFLVEKGAGAVIGSHPHVVQDTVHMAGVPVIYSTGNAVSNMSAPNTRLALAVELVLVQENPTGKVSLADTRLHFLWCTLPGRLREGYHTIELSRFTGRRDLWRDPSDYDEMIKTYKRVLSETGI
ncbi:MAG: CapA family protein [Bacteroidales bacterium]|nr:CapA family protein [Bacteroidales bacterium]